MSCITSRVSMVEIAEEATSSATARRNDCNWRGSRIEAMCLAAPKMRDNLSDLRYIWHSTAQCIQPVQPFAFILISHPMMKLPDIGYYRWKYVTSLMTDEVVFFLFSTSCFVITCEGCLSKCATLYLHF